jgi:hypothetical protein
MSATKIVFGRVDESWPRGVTMTVPDVNLGGDIVRDIVATNTIVDVEAGMRVALFQPEGGDGAWYLYATELPEQEPVK